MRALRRERHFLKSKANVTPQVFSLVLRRRVEITGSVVGNVKRIPVGICLEEIEFALRTENESVAELLCVVYRLS